MSCSDSSGRSDIRSRSAPERNPSAICIGEDARRGRGNPRIYFGQAETPTSVARARQPSDAPSSWGSQSPHRSLSDRRNTWCPHPCGSCPYDVRSAHSARGDVRPKQLTKAIGDEPAALQPFGVERHPQTVMPKNFQQVTAFPAEDVKIANMWIPVQRFLNLQCKTVHSTAHVSCPSGQPDTNTGWRDNHRRSTLITRRSVTRPTSCPTLTDVPSGSVISTLPPDVAGPTSVPEDGSTCFAS